MPVAVALNGLVDWHKAITAIDKAPSGIVLPCFIDCPLCSARARVLKDDNCGGAWFVCASCNTYCDMIELAATTWKISIEAAISKLITVGTTKSRGEILETVIEKYKLNVIDWRNRLNDYCINSGVTLSLDNSKLVREFQQKLGFRTGLNADRCLAGPSKYMGASAKKEIDDLFLKKQHTNYKLPKSHAVCKGGNWDELLTIPFHDLPNRVKGFLIIGRDLMARTGDIFFKPIKWTSKTVKISSGVSDATIADNDSGIAMWEATEHRHLTNDTVLVLHNPLLAMRIHCNHFQDHTTTLPIISTWRDARVSTQEHVWANIGAGKYVFWGPPGLKAHTIMHAKSANGYVITQDWPKDDISYWARNCTIQSLKTLFESAIPWHEALATSLRELPDAQAEDLLHQVRLKPEQLSNFFIVHAPDLRERLDPILRDVIPRRTVNVNDQVIIESDEGWKQEFGNILISDAIIRIEKAIQHSRGGRYYSGYVIHAGATLPFYSKAQDVDDFTLDWLRDLLVKAGRGYPIVAFGWGNRLTSVASFFHKPISVIGYDDIGWCAEGARFVFPDYSILPGGEIIDSVVGYDLNDYTIPAAMLPRPGEFTRTDAEVLSTDDNLTKTFWAVTTGILYNLLAHMTGDPLTGIALIGQDGVASVQIIARLLGCVEHEIRKAYTYQWPPIYILPDHRGRDGYIAGWLEDTIARSGIIWVNNEIAGSVIGCNGKWNILDTSKYLTTTKQLPLAAPKVIPEFIHHLAKSRFDFDRTNGLVAGIVKSLAGWFADVGGNPVTVFLGANEMDWRCEDTDHYVRTHKHFFNTILKLYDNGDLRIIGYDKKQKRIEGFIIDMRDFDNGGIFISRPVLNRVLHTMSITPLDMGRVTEALTNTNSLNSDAEVGGMPGWMIKTDTWSKELDIWRSRRGMKVRIFD